MAPMIGVLDIGKTNLKVMVATADGEPVEAISRPHDLLRSAPYPSIDIEAIVSWFLDTLSELARRHQILALISTAHGGGGVLVGAHGPVLPMMDYEAVTPQSLDKAYDVEAPPYSEVFCRTGSGALQLAKQLLWQAEHDPAAFGRARYFLTTAQYVAWVLGGRPASEISQVAAQGHLWDPRSERFSSVIVRHEWDRLFPAFAKAGEVLGHLAPELARRIGLPREVEVLCGVHDSNANLFRYKAAGMADRAILSTGTWMIAFERAYPLERLDGARAMVSNVDVDREPIASTLTMTGREYARLAGIEPIADSEVIASLPGIVARGTLPLPSFAEHDGLFAGSANRGSIIGPPPENETEKRAVAALYAALTAHTCLSYLDSRAPIVIDGGFATNVSFGRLLSGLRPGQPVTMSLSKDGTALGAALLWKRFERRAPVASVALHDVEPLACPGLGDAAARWVRLADEIQIPPAKMSSVHYAQTR
jgi:sugar (pentulose or hexulose) kinase